VIINHMGKYSWEIFGFPGWRFCFHIAGSRPTFRGTGIIVNPGVVFHTALQTTPFPLTRFVFSVYGNGFLSAGQGGIRPCKRCEA
jgi:hypothetical protein